METIGFHSKIKLDNREFHVHTGSVTEKNVVLSEIFEKGKFISAKNIDFFTRSEDGSPRETYVKYIAEKLHKEMLDEIDILFFVHAKIKFVDQYLPHYRLGSVFYEKGFYSEARENLQRVVELKSDFIPAYHRLGLCYINTGEYEKAIEIFEKGVKIQPDFLDLVNALGVVLCLTHDYKNASRHFQDVIKKNPDYDEANFNLGVVLYRSMLEGEPDDEITVIPSRITRYIKSLKILERYSLKRWQERFDQVLDIIKNSGLESVLTNLENLQIKLVTDLKINSLLDIFFLRFMYGGRELTKVELEEYEEKIKEQELDRGEFADYWNDIGIIHMIQCRNLFLSALSEFEKAAEFNQNYEEAQKNLNLVKNNKKGFLILLRAILK